MKQNIDRVLIYYFEDLQRKRIDVRVDRPKEERKQKF